jgi:hydrogenase maturation protease
MMLPPAHAPSSQGHPGTAGGPRDTTHPALSSLTTHHSPLVPGGPGDATRPALLSLITHHSSLARRILVAGIGNIFLGDDGFGVEVARRLAAKSLPDGVLVADFGIRGLDLAYEMLNEYDALVFVDIARRGGTPGTLYLIEPDMDDESAVAVDAHGMDPVKVFALARSLGARPARAFLVACEPAVVGSAGDEDVLVGLSAPVQAAVDEAVSMVESLVEDLCRAQPHDERR